MQNECAIGTCTKGCCAFCVSRNRCEDVCSNDPKKCGCWFPNELDYINQPDIEDDRLPPRAKTLKWWTIEQDTELIELYKSGLTVRQVATKIGRGRTATQVRLHQLGVRLRGGRDRGRKNKTDGGDINERSCF